MNVFEYATVHLILGNYAKPGILKLFVRTTFYVVDDGEITRTTQTDPSKELFDKDSVVHDCALLALAPQLALLGSEGWEIVDHKFSTTGSLFAQALLKRKAVKGRKLSSSALGGFD